MNIESEYKERYETYLKSIASKLQSRLIDELKDVPRIDRVSARTKGPTRFVKKSEKQEENGNLKYSNPLTQIQD